MAVALDTAGESRAVRPGPSRLLCAGNSTALEKHVSSSLSHRRGTSAGLRRGGSSASCWACPMARGCCQHCHPDRPVIAGCLRWSWQRGRQRANTAAPLLSCGCSGQCGGGRGFGGLQGGTESVGKIPSMWVVGCFFLVFKAPSQPPSLFDLFLNIEKWVGTRLCDRQ